MRVVKGVDDADAVGQNGRFILDKAIGRQASSAFANAHRASCRMEPQPNLGGRCDRIIKPRAVWIQVQVVRTHRAARQRKFSKADLGRDMHLFGPEPRPNRVERLQPAKQQGILATGHRPRQGLVQVVMGIHQPRRDHGTVAGNGFGPIQWKARTNLGDLPPAQTQIDAAQNAAPRIHGYQRVDIPDQGVLHLLVARLGEYLERCCVDLLIGCCNNPPPVVGRPAGPVGDNASGGLDHPDGRADVIGL